VNETETEPKPGRRQAGGYLSPCAGRAPGKAGPPVSLEAICWVLNLAPVPRPWRHVESRAGRTRQLRAPTGKGAFPSVQATWVRYTALSEHTRTPPWTGLRPRASSARAARRPPSKLSGPTSGRGARIWPCTWSATTWTTTWTR
jgi:hypothetical protein